MQSVRPYDARGIPEDLPTEISDLQLELRRLDEQLRTLRSRLAEGQGGAASGPVAAESKFEGRRPDRPRGVISMLEAADPAEAHGPSVRCSGAETLHAVDENRGRQELEELERRVAQARAERIRRLTLRFGSRETAERILSGDLWIGMSRSMVLESLGEPLATKRAVSRRREREEWTYRELSLLFEGGALIYFEDSRLSE